MSTAPAPAPAPADAPAPGDRVKVSPAYVDPLYRGREGAVTAVTPAGPAATLVAVRFDDGEASFWADQIIVTVRAGAR